MRALHPGLAVGLPEGWFGKVSLTVFAPDGEANVIVSSEARRIHQAPGGNSLRGEHRKL
jgi:hypothetical protein